MGTASDPYAAAAGRGDASAVRAWLIVGGRASPRRGGDRPRPAAAIPIESRLGPWRHARLVATAEQVTIEDLGSKNGTTVRGERVTGVQPPVDDVNVVIGDIRLLFRSGDQVIPTLSGPR